MQRSRLVVGGGAQCELRGETLIYLRHQLSKIDARFHLAHELAELRLKRLGVRHPLVERWANYIAAAILTPRRVFARSMAAGLSLAELADEYMVTQTLAALRMSELTGDPRAVVCPHRVYTAGEGALPSDIQARALARGPERAGVRRARLTDGRRRTLLEFEAA